MYFKLNEVPVAPCLCSSVIYFTIFRRHKIVCLASRPMSIVKLFAQPAVCSRHQFAFGLGTDRSSWTGLRDILPPESMSENIRNT